MHEKNIRLSVVNPYYVRNFARSYRDLAKTDKIDEQLSEYGARIQEKKEDYCLDLEELTERRIERSKERREVTSRKRAKELIV